MMDSGEGLKALHGASSGSTGYVRLPYYPPPD